MASDQADPNDLTATRAAMAATRRSLNRRLDALRDRLTGLTSPTSSERTGTVPPKAAKSNSTKTRATKSSGRSSPTKGKESSAKKSGGSKAAEAKTRPSASRTTRKAAGNGGSKTKSSGKGGTRSRKPSLARAALNEAKEVATDVLIGAAAGAVRGAAEAAVGHAEEGVEKVEQLAQTEASPGGSTAKPSKKSGR